MIGEWGGVRQRMGKVKPVFRTASDVWVCVPEMGKTKVRYIRVHFPPRKMRVFFWIIFVPCFSFLPLPGVGC